MIGGYLSRVVRVSILSLTSTNGLVSSILRTITTICFSTLLRISRSCGGAFDLNAKQKIQRLDLQALKVLLVRVGLLGPLDRADCQVLRVQKAIKETEALRGQKVSLERMAKSGSESE